jgi:uncharacterized protein YjbJ (UPF0337 family)
MSVNKDQVQGRSQEAQGKAKQVIGNAVGNKKLEIKGTLQKHVGAAQASVGDAEHNIDKAVKTS